MVTIPDCLKVLLEPNTYIRLHHRIQTFSTKFDEVSIFPYQYRVRYKPNHPEQQLIIDSEPTYKPNQIYLWGTDILDYVGLESGFSVRFSGMTAVWKNNVKPYKHWESSRDRGLPCAVTLKPFVLHPDFTMEWEQVDARFNRENPGPSVRWISTGTMFNQNVDPFGNPFWLDPQDELDFLARKQ